jgi:8-oxo-dGTP pyrophosphatase MutT (NUDIX family)
MEEDVGEKRLPPEEWVKTLHRVPYASGCLMRDQKGRVLVGKVVGENTWTIPGGVGEKGESPRTTALREVREEIGVRVRKPQLLSTHYLLGEDLLPERMQYIFDGGVLSPRQVAQIQIPVESEWGEYAFVSEREGKKLLSPDLGIKLSRMLRAIKNNRSFYIESHGNKIVFCDL